MRQEMPINDPEVWNRSERPYVQALVMRRSRIVRTGAGSGSEVMKFVNRIAGKKRMRELADIEPFVRGSLQSTVVEVKAVHIDVDYRHSSYPELLIELFGTGAVRFPQSPVWHGTCA